MDRVEELKRENELLNKRLEYWQSLYKELFEKVQKHYSMRE